MNNDLTLPAVVDEISAVATSIAVLETREKELKAILIASGLKEICGTTTRVVVSHIAAGITIEWKALAEAFKPSAEMISQYSKPRAGCVRVSIHGYN
jgi:hypothetical protein